MSLPDTQETTAPAVPTDAFFVETAVTGCEEEEESNDCCCCHCLDVKRAMEKVEFLKTPEGQRRKYMKLAAKNFFMDFMAMAQVRKKVLNELYGKNDKNLARNRSFPITICKVEEVTDWTLLIKWWVHDHSDVNRYEIYIDCKFVKSVFDATSDETIVSGIDATQSHHIRMKAVPKRMADQRYREIEETVREICCICPECPSPCRVRKRDLLLKPLQKKYFTNLCVTTSGSWEDSEFLYTPEPESDNNE